MMRSLPTVPTPLCYGLALLAGALHPLAFSPFSCWIASPMSICLLLLSLRNGSIKQAVLTGWLYGVGFFGVGVSWVYVSIHEFGAASPLLAGSLTLAFVCALALFFALHIGLWRWLFGRCSVSVLAFAFPAFWVIAEWFRSWFLTGFPWILSGYASLDTPLAGWAPIVGVYGLSFWLVLLGTGLYLLIAKLRDLKSGPKADLIAFILAAPLLLGALLGTVTWTKPQSELHVALIQGNTPQNLKWAPKHRDNIIQGYINASAPYFQTDLIIWPETAIPRLQDIALPQLKPLETELSRKGTGLITGIPSRVFSYDETSRSEQARYYNSVIGLAQAQGVYHKQRLVPFGEYVPLEFWLRGLIDFFDLPMSNFSLGSADQPPLSYRMQNGDAARISAFICYEIVYPDLVAKNSRDVDIMLTISNDGWFADSLAPHQHLQMSRLRALENGRWLIRATNNGISAFIDDKGEIRSQGPQFVATTLTDSVLLMDGQTPFNRFGSWPVLGVCGLLLAFGGLSRRRGWLKN